MSFVSVSALFGGLSFFLFGIYVMTRSLAEASGGRLESALGKITSKPLRALFLGTGITAAAQSSSAVTVMLVGLADTGIIPLEQTVGVIMGSNIGTTATPWILCLSDVGGDNPVFTLFKTENLSPASAVIGIILLFFAKKERRKDIGLVLLGFAVLLYGMELMKKSAAPLSESGLFARLLPSFNNPVFGIICGAVFTALLQSSSASAGILQALSATGAISLGTAVPLIVGQNIGTCATALLSSASLGRNAKRVTTIHFGFNLFGAVLCLAVFYGTGALFFKDCFNYTVNPVGIAAIHSAFNIVTSLALLPFSSALVHISEKIIPDK